MPSPSYELSFSIDPVPASRPRVTQWGTYYGKKYKGFKKTMEELVVSYRPTKVLEDLISADMTFFVPIPKSWSKKKKAAKVGKYCDNNADLDNYEKAILDSLNGHYFIDDRQIVEQASRKIYAEQGSIHIIIKEIGDVPR
jgi:Holliday junction resolvase RusA-like endonuclease